MGKYSAGLIAVISCLLAGCSTVPQLPPDDSVNVNDMIVNIRCEFQRAGNKAKFLKETEFGYTVGADLSLQVLNGSEALLDTSYSLPYSSVFFPALGGRAAQAADSTRSVSIEMDYAGDDKRKCDNEVVQGRPRLRGELGFAEWAEKLQETVDDERLLPTKATYSLEFTLERSAAFTPGFGNKTPAEGAAQTVWKITPKLSANTKRVHKLLIVVTKNDPPAKPQKVVIVKDGKTVKKLKFNAPSRNNAENNRIQRLFEKLDRQSE